MWFISAGVCCSSCGLVLFGALAAVARGAKMLLFRRVIKMFYTHKPIHLVYPVLLFFLGALCMAHGYPWDGLGAILWLLAGCCALWIIIGGFWSDRSRYYDSVADALEQAAK